MNWLRENTTLLGVLILMILLPFLVALLGLVGVSVVQALLFATVLSFTWPLFYSCLSALSAPGEPKHFGLKKAVTAANGQESVAT